MSDRLVALLLLVGSGFFYLQTFAIRPPPFAAFEALGAETFPRWVTITLAVFSAVLLVRGSGPLIPRFERAAVGERLGRYRLPLLSLAFFAAYTYAIELVGWILASLAFLIALQLLLLPRLGRSLLYVVVGSAAFAWGLAQIFERFLHVVLPRGSLF